MTVDARAQRRREAHRRTVRRRRIVAGSGVALLAVLVGSLLATHGGGKSPAQARVGAKRRTAVAVPTLAPPGPFGGYLLIADRGNNRMLLVDGAKRIFWSFPRPSGTAMPFRFDDDTFFGPRNDRIVSNQEDQHTIQIISFPGGRVLWRYGHVDRRGSAPGYLNTPDDAYLLGNGLVTVADAYNCRVLFISPAHRIVRQYGTTGVCRHDPPRTLGAVNGATPLADGGTLVSEIAGSWIDDIGPDGALRWAVRAPVSYPSDPQLLGPNRILLADYARPGHVIIMTRTGRVLWRYGPSSGPGALDHPSLATRFVPGLIAVNDDFRHRVVFISIRTHRIVWQYGHTDVPGRAPGYLHTPDGMDFLTTAAAQASPTLRRLLAARPAAKPSARTAAAPGGALTVLPAGYRLPAPVQREVAVASNGAVVLAGGLDSAGQSTSGVFRLDPASGALTSLGSLPEPVHDAAGGLIGGTLFVFGGGSAHSSSSVQAFDLATHRSRIAARLPHPLSDVVSATVGGVVYLVGGYDDRRPRAEIWRTSDGVHFELAGRLPVGLRYPAIAAVGSTLVIAGGVAASGPVSTVYAFDTAGGGTTLLGRLPGAVGHASAVAFGGDVFVVGGTNPAAGARIDVAGRHVAPLGAPVAVADAAVVPLGSRALLIGGTRGGTAVSDVRVLSVAARR